MQGTPKHTTRVFSGVQPTGNLHLGNYLGAITKFVEMQADHECLFCVVDMHAITVWQDPDELTANTREVTAAYHGGRHRPGEAASSSFRARSPVTPNSPGCSIASPGSAGSTG